MFLLLLLAAKVSAQDVHNFKMDPEKTDCHELELTGEFSQNVKLIEKSTFRYIHKMSISRYYVPNSVAFYSCDGVLGYLIAVENEKSVLYPDIRKTLYDSLLQSDDPIQFYQNQIKTKLKN